jgi:hypothetical protein
MLLRMVLYIMVGYFIYRLVQLAGRMMSSRRDDDEKRTPPPEPHIPDYRDIKDADFIDITPKDKKEDNPGGS